MLSCLVLVQFPYKICIIRYLENDNFEGARPVPTHHDQITSHWQSMYFELKVMVGLMGLLGIIKERVSMGTKWKKEVLTRPTHDI